MKKGIPWFLLLFFMMSRVQSTEINFIALDVDTGHVLSSVGPSLDQRVAPCSTFKIVLSLIGYDLGILKNQDDPVWPYDGSPVLFESQKGPQSPKTWISYSVIWYSKILARKIGKDTLQRYLSPFVYGNQDISGDAEQGNGFTTAHLSSSLRISPKEQVYFLKKLLSERLPVSPHAVRATKEILFEVTFDSGWKLFGKAGSGFHEREDNKIAWYVGWIEKPSARYVFALLMTGLDRYPTKKERQEYVREFLCDKWSGENNGT